jgi:hypothetical protein
VRREVTEGGILPQRHRGHKARRRKEIRVFDGWRLAGLNGLGRSEHFVPWKITGEDARFTTPNPQNGKFEDDLGKRAN